MVVVGFGDMFGKIMFLVDWEIFCYFVGEFYLLVGVKIVQEVFDVCIEYIEDIVMKMEIGIQVLMEFLIVLGFVMLVLDYFCLVLGGEYYIFYWIEMELMEKNWFQIFYGVKVGCVVVLLIDIYRKFVQDDGLNEFFLCQW